MVASGRDDGTGRGADTGTAPQACNRIPPPAAPAPASTEARKSRLNALVMGTSFDRAPVPAHRRGNVSSGYAPRRSPPAPGSGTPHRGSGRAPGTRPGGPSNGRASATGAGPVLGVQLVSSRPTWVRAVAGLITSSAAISPLVWPRPTRASEHLAFPAGQHGEPVAGGRIQPGHRGAQHPHGHAKFAEWARGGRGPVPQPRALNLDAVLDAGGGHAHHLPLLLCAGGSTR